MIDRDDIIGRRIASALRTKIRVRDLAKGLPEACYYELVLELDSGFRVAVENDSLRKWAGTDKLYPLASGEYAGNRALPIVGQKLVAVCVDDVGMLYLLLSNGLALNMDPVFGHYLHVQAFAEILTDIEEGRETPLRDFWAGMPVDSVPELPDKKAMDDER